VEIGRTNRQDMDKAVCKFGPGGQFVSLWAGGSTNAGGPLGKVLAAITDIVMATFAAEALAQPGPIPTKQEKSVDGSKKPNLGAYAAATAAFKGSGAVSGQAMLFGNNSGAGRAVGHKPQYRIRAYRRSSRKRVVFGTTGQGLLFEDNGKRAKTA